MFIVIEGPDGSGKSTLAAILAKYLSWEVLVSGGPPKYPAEINDRLRIFMHADRVVFDRHPVFSESIYGAYRASEVDQPIDPELERYFFNRNPLIIYCRRPSHVALDDSGHRIKPTETKEHLGLIKAYDAEIVSKYDQVLMPRAHMIYRIGDRINPLLLAVEAYIHGA